MSAAVDELVEQSAAARERVWRSLGSLEPFALGQSPGSSSLMAGPKWPAVRQNFRVIHRPSGNVMIVSDGLRWDSPAHSCNLPKALRLLSAGTPLCTFGDAQLVGSGKQQQTRWQRLQYMPLLMLRFPSDPTPAVTLLTTFTRVRGSACIGFLHCWGAVAATASGLAHSKLKVVVPCRGEQREWLWARVLH